MKMLQVFRWSGALLLSAALAFAGCEPVPYADPASDDDVAPAVEDGGVDVDVDTDRYGADVDAEPNRPLEGLDVDVNAGEGGVDVDVDKDNPDIE